jgi:hypothetical protein
MTKKVLIVGLIVSVLVITGLLFWQVQKPRGEWFQVGNEQDITKLKVKKSEELEDNRIGCMLSPEFEGSYEGKWRGGKQFARFVNEMGFKHVRLSKDYFDFENVDWGRTHSVLLVEPEHDEVVNGLINKGVKIRYGLVFWDLESPGQKEGECDEEENCYSRFKSQEEIDRYLDYARFIVDYFKGRVEYYEILNEPIVGSGTQQAVEVEDYINLVKQVVPVIRQVDPAAKVVIGAIPNLYEPEDYKYLLTLLRSDVISIVDGISFHGLHGVSPDYEYKKDYYNYPSVLKEIKSIAVAHGFGGEFMGDELIWRTDDNPLESEPWTYSKHAVAKYYARGVVTQLGLGVAASTVEIFEGPRFLAGKKPAIKALQNLATVMAGVKSIELPVEIQSEAKNIKSYSFSLSSGDKLVALWTDGVAVDEDAGVIVAVTVPKITARRVTAVDALNGYQQDIVISSGEGDTLLQNLIIRDYPLLLRIEE